MKDIMIKVYGYLEIIANKNETMDAINENLSHCLNALHNICHEWYLEESIFSVEDNILQITHEGDYFPHKEVAMVLAKYINQTSKGKLDIIDLEAWTLQRFFLDAEHNSLLLKNKNEELPYSRKSSLNHALEAAQEKNSGAFKYKN